MRGLRCYVYCMRYARGTCDPVVVRREEKKSGALLLRRRHGSRPVRYGDLEQWHHNATWQPGRKEGSTRKAPMQQGRTSIPSHVIAHKA